MNPKTGRHFESIESAREFVGLLSETVHEVKKEINADIEKALESKSARHVEALRTVSYNLEKLGLQMKKSCRILNDLRTLRRLLCEERRPAARTSKPNATVRTEVRLPSAGTCDADSGLRSVSAD